MDEDPNNDVTPPCPDCGEVSIPCPCEKGISTVGQLQRALEVIGPLYSLTVSCDDGEWTAKLYSVHMGSFSRNAPTMHGAIDEVIRAYWEWQ